MKGYQNKIVEILFRDYFPVEEDWLIESQMVTKNNATKIAAVTIKKSSDAVASVHYVNGFYFENYTPEAAAHRIYEIYEKEVRAGRMHLELNTKNLTDWEQVKNRIYYKVVNAKMNKDFLQEVPNISLTPDLSLCFYIRHDDDATITITEKIAKTWGFPKDIIAQQLYEIAEANIKRTNPATLCSMVDVLKEMLPPELYEDAEIGGRFPLYVLTNKNKVFGAAAIAYERGQLLERCREQIEKSLGIPLGGIYILPSSVHECILLPATPDTSVPELHAMVMEVNRTQVAPEEKLSDEIFYFDKQDGLMQLTFNERVISR